MKFRKIFFHGCACIKNQLNGRSCILRVMSIKHYPIWGQIPNFVTLSRVPLLFIIVALLYIPLWGAATLSFLLFVVAALSDWLDGYLARRYKIVSNFGKLMDALTDKVLTVGMYVTLLAKGILPAWALILVLLILCREFLVTGLRLVAAGQGKILAAERLGKVKTILQLFSIGSLLFAYMASGDFVSVLNPGFVRFSHHFAYVSFVVAVILTVFSGVRYLQKYWSTFIHE